MKRITDAEMMEAIKKFNGNLAAVGRYFGMQRAAVWTKVTHNPELNQAMLDVRESFKDNAESVLQKKVLEGCTPELIFYMKTQCYDRGYGRRDNEDKADNSEAIVELLKSIADRLPV